MTAYVAISGIFYELRLLKEINLISLNDGISLFMTIWWLYVARVYLKSPTVHLRYPEHCKVFKMQFISNCVFSVFSFVYIYVAVALKKNSASQ